MPFFPLKSFLGLVSYNRWSIKNFDTLPKPLTAILRHDIGKISVNKSKNVEIKLGEVDLQVFNKFKSLLISEDVMLIYPDFIKPFDFTTDASLCRLGPVLYQSEIDNHAFYNIKGQLIKIPNY